MAERAARVVGLICSVAVLAITALYFARLLPKEVDSFFLIEPLVGVILLTQGVRLWNKTRGAAWFSFAAAIFIATVTLIIKFYK